MKRKRNVILVGFMGTGKTTVGRLLAARLGMKFVDMDDMIAAREGKTIPRIFAENGEPHFRRVERSIVEELASQDGWVVGTGGGIVLNPENVRDFARTGLIVCLWAEPATILSRVIDDDQRPLLAGGDKLRRISELLEKRRPLYEAIPTRVDTTPLSPTEVVEEISRLVVDG